MTINVTNNFASGGILTTSQAKNNLYTNTWINHDYIDTSKLVVGSDIRTVKVVPRQEAIDAAYDNFILDAEEPPTEEDIIQFLIDIGVSIK